MAEKPDYVAEFSKPTNTEIKHIGNGWYLYACSSRYDPKDKKSHKVSGPCLGKITAEGVKRHRSDQVKRHRMLPGI
ncbi:MAG: hypothetical protein Q4F72_09010, partial [Desulfovibrionaceae bacterium]|nr:hypothetical protein [Desulfovibrionaceae bacterium]